MSYKELCLRHVGSDNHNVMCALLYTAFVSVSNGIVFSGLFAAYLYLITNKSNEKVGYSEGVFGIFSMFWGLLGGWMADRYRRDTIVRRGGYIAVIGTVILLVLFSIEMYMKTLNDKLEEDAFIGSYVFLFACVGCIIVQVGESVADSASRAIFADSIKTGTRLQLMTKFAITRLSMALLGQLITIIIFVSLGNTWTVTDLCIVESVGFLFRIPACIVCFFFDDSKSLAVESKAVVQDAGSKFSKSRKYRFVPWILFAVQFVWCLGSGITVKFIPIFFQTDKKDGLDVSPAVVTAVLAGRRVSTLIATKIYQRIAVRIGRVPMGIIGWSSGISFWTVIVVMGYLNDYNTHFVNRLIIMSFFVIRSGLLSGSSATDSSINMDYVPKERRGFFTSLSAITSASWSGTAVVGGVLVDRGSYKVAFTVTLALHVFSVILRIPLLWLVPRQQHHISNIQKNIDTLRLMKVLLLSKGSHLSLKDTSTIKEFLMEEGPSEDVGCQTEYSDTSDSQTDDETVRLVN
eukprot:TRINITY_DN16584_c0_g1_i1.p1 TRINITY_DN16584_c0_g1~~TRINITY_DN16584_c0_g1_i1.p1  ORF type:complete len:518 (+),score=64.68 TRINITY_DN16584_c0_g1_i1:83-1636(+)